MKKEKPVTLFLRQFRRASRRRFVSAGRSLIFFALLAPRLLPAQGLLAGEYFIDADPGEGLGTALAATDFAYDADIETAALGNLATDALAPGHHRIGVRFRTAAGWGSAVYSDVCVFEDTAPAAVPDAAGIMDAEWFIGQDPGVGRGLPLTAADGAFDSADERVRPVETRPAFLEPGVHQAGLRFRTKDGVWGNTRTLPVMVYTDEKPASPAVRGIAEAEYFWGEPPVGGAGFPAAWSPLETQAGLASVNDAGVSSTALVPGQHKLGVRFKDSGGNWGLPVVQLVDVGQEATPFTNVTLHVESNIGVPSFNLDSVQKMGETVALRVPPTILFDGVTYFSIGWIGTGDAPANGTEAELSFVIGHDSTVTWLWSSNRTVRVAVSNDFERSTGGGLYTRFGSVKVVVPEYVCVNEDERWRLTGYTGTGSVPAYVPGTCPTQIVFRASEDSSLTCQWNRQYRVRTSARNGRVENNREWYDEGTLTSLVPEPDAGYAFEKWQGDVNGTAAPGPFTVAGALSVEAVFAPTAQCETVNLTVFEITGTATSLICEAGSRVSVTPRIDSVSYGTSKRDIVSGWSAQGGLAATGKGTNVAFVIEADTEVRWQALRQYKVVPRKVPSDGGTIRVSGRQTRPDADWYDAGIIRVTASPAAGYRFSEWYLKDWREPDVETVLDDQSMFAAMFRREKPLTGFTEIRGGNLNSPNTAAYEFTHFFPTFLMQRHEVTTAQYAQFLNESLENRTIRTPDLLSVRGQMPLADYVQGVRVEYYTGDNVGAEPLFRNQATSLAFDFADGSPADAGYGAPASTVALTDNFSMRLMGELYVPATGTVGFKACADDAVVLNIDGVDVLRDASPSNEVTQSVSLTQGWHALEITYVEYTGAAFMNLQWDTAGGGNYADIPTASLRVQAVSAADAARGAQTGAFTYYDELELYDLDAPNANIELVNGVYRPKEGQSNHPVVEVTWYGADAYCRWLAACTGEPVDLPTEWMWEYAASAGDSTVGGRYYPWGAKFAPVTHDMANYTGTGGIDTYLTTAPVGTFPACNDLYDMAGNVWEWTQSRQDASSSWRVIRGGSFNQTYNPYLATSYRAAYKSEDYGDESTGFRACVSTVRPDFLQAGYVQVDGALTWTSPNTEVGGFTNPSAPFELKAVEIRNREYAQFLNTALEQGWCRMDGQAVKGASAAWFEDKAWLTLTTNELLAADEGVFVSKTGYEDYAVAGLSWYGAKAYVQWLNLMQSVCLYDLPTEWQWEKAMAAGTAGNTVKSDLLAAVGITGMDSIYGTDMWPGFYDALGNVQEWTASQPDADMAGAAVLRGGAWNLPIRNYTDRTDYADKEAQRDSFGFRPAVQHVVPVFGWKQQDVLLAPLSGVYTQILDAAAYDTNAVLSWILDAPSPAWAAVTNIGGGCARLILTPPQAQTSETVRVWVSDGVMSNSLSFAAVIASNAVAILGLPETVKYANDGQTRTVFLRGVSTACADTYDWSLPAAPDWASILSVTDSVARIDIQTTAPRTEALLVRLTVNGVSATKSVNVVIGNLGPQIITGPDAINFEQIPDACEVSLLGCDTEAWQPLSWSIEGNPTWAQVIWSNQAEAMVRISRPAPTFSTNLTVMLSDGAATGRWTFAVFDTNRVPQITESISRITASRENPPEDFVFKAVDDDISDTLTWTLDKTSEVLAIRTQQNGMCVLRLETLPEGFTNETFKLTVSDGIASDSVPVTVLATNQSPVITGDIQNQSFTKDTGTQNLDVFVTDADLQQHVTIEVENQADWFTWQLLSADAIQILVSTAQTIDNGVIHVVADDGFSTVSQDIMIQVTNAVPAATTNDPPRIIGLPDDLVISHLSSVRQYFLTVADADLEDPTSWWLKTPHPAVGLVVTGSRTATLTVSPFAETALTNIVIQVSDGKATTTASFNLTITSANLDGHLIAAAEYFFDTDPGPGAGTPLVTEDGEHPYRDTLTMMPELPVYLDDTLSAGAHKVGFRMKNRNGVWGNTAWRDFIVFEDVTPAVAPALPVLVDAKYSVDGSLIDGQTGRQLPALDEYDSAIESSAAEWIDTAGLLPGAYSVLSAFSQQDSVWSTNAISTFIVFDNMSVTAPSLNRIVAAEYFWDVAPSPGFAYPIPVVSETGDASGVVSVDASAISTGSLSPGTHCFGIRFQDASGAWGNPNYRTVSIEVEDNPLTLVNLHVESNIGDPELAFDTQHPTNTLMSLSVPETYYYNDQWWVIQGWIGVGDVPGYGDSNKVSFVLNQASDLTWIWIQDVEVLAYSDYGTVTGTGTWEWYPEWKTGEGMYGVMETVTLSVEQEIANGSGARLVCTGYTGTGSAPAEGSTNQVSFTLKNPVSEVYWQWQQQYLLTASVSGHGRIFGNRQWYAADTTATLSALADEGYEFVRWEGDAEDESATLPIAMDQAHSVTAVFRPQSDIASNQYSFSVIDPLTGSTNLVGMFTSGTVVTASCQQVSYTGTGSRFVVTGWVGSGSVPVTGLTNTVAFAVQSDSMLAWQGFRQYYVSAEALPNDLGQVTVFSQEQDPCNGGWFTLGYITISNQAANGAHFLKYDRDLKGEYSGSVTRYLNAPLDVTGLFRENQSVTNWISLTAGVLTSPNSNVSGFQHYMDGFDMKPTEVSNAEYVRYLNDSLRYKTLERVSDHAVQGRPECRPFVSRLSGLFYPNDHLEGLPTYSRSLLPLTPTTLLSSGSFSPTVTLSLTNGFSGVVEGEVFCNTEEELQLEISGTAKVSLDWNGVPAVEAATGVYSAAVFPKCGWNTIKLVFTDAGDAPVVGLRYKLQSMASFAEFDSSYLRHEARTGTAVKQWAATRIGDDVSSTAVFPNEDQIRITPTAGPNFVFSLVNQMGILEAIVPRPASGKAGLMIRNSNLSGAPYFLLGVNSTGQILCEYRKTADGAAVTGRMPFTVADTQIGLRLVKVGNRIQASAQRGGKWLDAQSASEEELWQELELTDASAAIFGCYADSAATTFSACRFTSPEVNNHFDGFGVLDLGAEACRIKWNGESYVCETGAELIPVVETTWFGARNYAEWLRETTMDSGFTLPTEWQFEYAASGGRSSLTNYPSDVGAEVTEFANVTGTSGADTFTNAAAVGSLHPFDGLYDLGGNVWEWTRSLHWKNGVWQTIKGGSWNQPVTAAATAYRDYYGLPQFSNGETGFRPIRNQSKSSPDGYVLIPSGTWQSPNDQAYGFEAELSDYYMKSTEVTVREFAECLNWSYARGEIEVHDDRVYGASLYAGKVLVDLRQHPYLMFTEEAQFASAPGCTQMPMINVSRLGALVYVHFLNNGDSRFTFGLPTEWEWEKASTAGLNMDYAWTNSCALSKSIGFETDGICEVASRGPSTVFDSDETSGLYDLLSNVGEWTSSRQAYASTLYGIRGLFVGYPADMRGATTRSFWQNDEFVDPYVGFRTVAYPAHLQVSALATDLSFVRDSGSYYLLLACNNPQEQNVGWFIENAPLGVTLSDISPTTSDAYLKVDTSSDFAGTNITVRVTDGDDNVTITFNVTETSLFGALRVYLEPKGVIANARWRIVGQSDTEQKASGDLVDGLPAPGSVQVEFLPVLYWTTPKSVTCIVTAGKETSVTGIYTVVTTPRGTPYWWMANYGISPNDNADTSDDDHDGHAAYMEYVAGTDPTNALSVLKMVDVNRSTPGQVEIAWSSVSNRFYDVLVSTNLALGFSAYTNNLQATPPINIETMNIPDDAPRYFKIRAQYQNNE